jgi:hypothetical protein
MPLGSVVSFVKVFSPTSEPELVTVVALLEAHDIPCFVPSAGFGSLYPGPLIHGYNMRAIMVDEAHAAAARELIRDFESRSGEWSSDEE